MNTAKGPDFATLTPAGSKPQINSIFDVSADFLGQLRLWLEQNPPAIGITNILGFQQFTVQPATTISASQTTTSTTFTDLATVGPTITGLSDGKYVVLFGCLADTGTAGKIAAMGVSANGAALGSPPSADDCESRVTNFVSIARALPVTLSAGGNNSLTAKYATDDALVTATFSSRWMIAIRYANK